MAASPRLDLPGSSLEAEFGGTGGGVRESPIAEATGVTVPTGSQSAPPKASSAPKANSKEVFTGLTEALNTNQQRLVKEGKYKVADIYEIEFAPVSLGDATVKRQGATDYTNTPLQNAAKSASAINSATNSVNMTSRTMQVSAGMQIVQFIDEVIRNSSYITDQQLYIVDEVTQKVKPNPNPPGGQVAWYKINVQATQLGYDEKRRDHAYRLKYIITPYAINSMQSDWFPNSRYRGSHKSYQYWFTGLNTSILNFEQEYNSLYRLIISGTNIPTKATSDFRDQYRRTYLPTSENHAKGAEGYTNEAGDNAASFLYSPTDQAKIKLRIVGDPAWMQQGEIAEGISARNFNFSPFNNDGTINYDSQEVVFDISWNRPADYDPNTGLMDLARSQVKPDGTYSNQPQENATYTAIKCKNIFSKGRFEQELEGRLIIEFNQNNTKNNANGRSVSGNQTTTNPVAGSRNKTNTAGNDADSQWDFSSGVGILKEDLQSPTSDTEQNESDGAPQPLFGNAPENPTSDGDIESLTDYDSAYQVDPEQSGQSQPSVAEPDYFGGLAGTTDGTTQLLDREA
jgi:hypothetical protein